MKDVIVKGPSLTYGRVNNPELTSSIISPPLVFNSNIIEVVDATVVGGLSNPDTTTVKVVPAAQPEPEVHHSYKVNSV